MSTTLSDVQLRILEALAAYLSEWGVAPSRRELSALVGQASAAGVHRHLVRLEAAGLVRQHPKVHRALQLTDEGRAVLPRAGRP